MIALLVLFFAVAASAHSHDVINHTCFHETYQKTITPFQTSNVRGHGHNMHTQATWEPMRISLFTSYLDKPNDDARACYNAGDKVKVGNPATVRACAPTVQGVPPDTDCWITCDSGDIMTPAMRSSLDTILASATGFYSSLFTIQRQTSNVKVTGTCGSMTSFVGTLGTDGLATDYILLVTARPHTHMTNVLAYAGFCAYDKDSKRPTVGHLNVNPKTITTNKDLQLVMKHELAHAFGFSASAMPLWRFPGQDTFVSYTDKDIVTYPTGPVSGSAVRAPGVWNGNDGMPFDFSKPDNVAFLVTPNVVAWARNHYQCSTITKVQLEDGGGGATAGSHWEKRLMYPEIMSGTQTAGGVMSRFTLATFQDMGFYRVDVSKAELMEYGAREGCNFVHGDCSTWPVGKYVCGVEGGQEFCDYSMRYTSLCRVSTIPGLLPRYQHFPSNPTLGGEDSLTDNCPLIIPFTTGGGGGDCRVVGNNPVPNYYSHVAGPNSFCMRGSVGMTEVSYLGEAARCIPAVCVNSVVNIVVNNTFYPCSGAVPRVYLTSLRSGEPGFYNAFYRGNVTCAAIDCALSVNNLVSFPVVDSIAPSSVLMKGGESVYVKGSSLIPGCVVYFGQKMAVSTTWSNSTSLVAVTPVFPLSERARVWDVDVRCPISGYCDLCVVKTVRDALTAKTEDVLGDLVGETATLIKRLLDDPKTELTKMPGLGILIGIVIIVVCLCCACYRMCCKGKEPQGKGQRPMMQPSSSPEPMYPQYGRPTQQMVEMSRPMMQQPYATGAPVYGGGAPVYGGGGGLYNRQAGYDEY